MTKTYNIIPLKNRRRELRKNSTPAEELLWKSIRNKKTGIRFVRQYSISGYVLDFYCPKYKIGIELEGKIHLTSTQKVYDEFRFRYLAAYDIIIFKIPNETVIHHLASILEKIKTFPSLELKRGDRGEL